MVMHCDNLTVVHVVNSDYSKDKDMMYMMLCMFFVQAYWGFKLHGEHISSEENVRANAIITW